MQPVRKLAEPLSLPVSTVHHRSVPLAVLTMVGSTDAYQAEVNATTRLAEIQSRAKRDIFRIKCFCYTAAFICMVIGMFTHGGVRYGLFPKELFYAGSIAVVALHHSCLQPQDQDHGPHFCRHLRIYWLHLWTILLLAKCPPITYLQDMLKQRSAPTNSVPRRACEYTRPLLLMNDHHVGVADPRLLLHGRLRALLRRKNLTTTPQERLHSECSHHVPSRCSQTPHTFGLFPHNESWFRV